jgi:uncharacterized membrane protein YtjA (UPF0391 family)
MLKWAVIFFVIAIIAGFFGFTGVESAATLVAKILFFIFLVGFIISLLVYIFIAMKIFKK